jgi:hypothetical protein
MDAACSSTCFMMSARKGDGCTAGVRKGDAQVHHITTQCGIVTLNFFEKLSSESESSSSSSSSSSPSSSSSSSSSSLTVSRPGGCAAVVAAGVACRPGGALTGAAAGALDACTEAAGVGTGTAGGAAAVGAADADARA